MKDYEYLLHLIYCFVHDEQPEEKPEDVSFYNVFALGKAHEVANIAFLSVERLENKPDEELYEQWKVYYYLSVQRDSRQQLAYLQALEALHGGKIRTLEAQGTVTKSLYPSRELRMMSDIDFIIDLDNLEKAMQIMRELGYETRQKQPIEFDALKDDGFLIEFHTEFFPEYMYNRRERYYAAINSPFSHAKSSNSDKLKYYLTDDYYYLYTVIHTIVHFETAGCGIRRILDLYYLKKAFSGKVDMGLVNSVINENGFKNAYEKLFALEEKWFENAEPKLDLTETESDVINSMNHGTGEIFMRNNIRKDEKEGIKFVKLKHLYYFVFPKKEMVYLAYPECEERGYSTFRCRLYRIFAVLKKLRFSHAFAVIKTIIKSK